MRILVTGGVRSGKSQHAERLLSNADAVRYVAPGPTSDDSDWAARISAHRTRRPQSWTTLETHDLAGALGAAGPVLIDCLGTWLTALLDAERLWEKPSEIISSVVERQLNDVVQALDRAGDVVLVTNEVGLGVVPEHRSGRVFSDQLGRTNQRVAEVCDEVHLVVAGRILVL